MGAAEAGAAARPGGRMLPTPPRVAPDVPVEALRYALVMGRSSRLPRADAVVATAVTVLLVVVAVGRQRALDPLSPPDLAFFHQSTWSALHGLGFAQTALPFDGQTLTGCIHLSPIRALWVPFYALLPTVETLVGLQALAMGLGAFLVGALARQAGASPRLAAVGALAYGLHPATVGLATADVRPLVFVVPAVLLAVLGLRSDRAGLVLLGALGVIAAREEAPWLLLALLPAAVWARRAWPVGALLVGIALAFAAPLLAWGHLSNISATTDPMRQWTDILAGNRPLLRDPQEAAFGLLALLLCLPALRVPSLLLPGLLAWTYLAVFSGLELAMSGQPGVHYLAVVHPFLWAAGAVGLGRMSQRPRLLLGVSGGAALVGMVASVWLLPGLPGWTAAAFSPSPGAQALHRLADPIAADPGGLVAEPRLAPTLAGRTVLHVRGNRHADRHTLEALVAELDWALLDADEPGADTPPAAEREGWRAAMSASGLTKDREREGVERWSRGAPSE